jgi:hypothetical protein
MATMFKSRKLRTVRCRMLRSELFFFWVEEDMVWIQLPKGSIQMVEVSSEVSKIDGKNTLYMISPFVRMYLKGGFEILVRSNIFELL